MARTKIVRNTANPTTSSYQSMSNSELKKIIDERKMEGRSKLTIKSAMIEALTFQDENPDDKKGLAELISKYSKVKKDSTSESSAASEDSVRVGSSSISKSGSKKSKTTKDSESKSSEPKVKKSKKMDWLEENGINRSDYPPGTQFTKNKMGKIKVHFPKDAVLSEDERETLESKILSVNHDIEQNKVESKIIVRKVPSKQSEPDELDDIPLVKQSKVPAVDPEETEEEDPLVIEMKRKEIKKMKKKEKLKHQVEHITNTLFGIDLTSDPMEEDQDTKGSQKRQREEKVCENEEREELEREELETEEQEREEEHDCSQDSTQDSKKSEFQKGYISLKRQQSKEISELCERVMNHMKYFDLNNDDYEDKPKLIKVLKKMDSILNKIK